ncbi:MAG: DNA-binding response regulator [Acidobacteria bacterium]|nr:MAG: DNA-binding response regulator [Acidobacteriota bacterium]
MSDEKIKILIADDHPIFRLGLRETIESEPMFEVVAEAENGEQALQLLQQAIAEIAILDINMPLLDGLSVVRHLKKAGSLVKLIILSFYKDERMLNLAFELGVCGYVLKEDAVEEIIDCIKTVAQNQNYISPSLRELFFKRTTGKSKFSKLNLLTSTEKLILYMISEYKTNKEIAEELSISIRTVENHRFRIAAKLKLKGKNALIKFATENKSKLLKSEKHKKENKKKN